MSELERIEDVLFAHDSYEWDASSRQFVCACGKSLGVTSYPDPAHRAHLADAIRAYLAEVAGRDEVREAMAAAASDAYWSEDHLRTSADAAVHAYLRAATGHESHRNRPRNYAEGEVAPEDHRTSVRNSGGDSEPEPRLPDPGRGIES